MEDHHTGETVKLVGAMMRLRHNAKFKGGLDLGGAPSSVAASKEHLDFLKLFSRRLRQQKQKIDGDEEVAGDGDMLTAKFAEAQIRALVNSELEACLVLHECEDFWQQRLERSWASLRNWLEMGPWIWRTHSPSDCSEECRDRLSWSKHILRIKILSAGSLQLHLTQMKQAYMDGALTAWNTSALAIIRRALEVKGLVVDDTLRGSLLSSISSPEPSPLSACDRGDILTVDSSGQPVLRPTCNAGRRESESSMRDGESLGEGIGESIEREIAVKPCRSVEILSPNRSGQNEEWGRARVDVGGVANDARDDGQCDEEKGQGEGEKEAGGFMEALLQTSEKLEAAVERQQKEMVTTLLGSVAPPSLARRNWFIIAVATPAVLASLLYMYRNRSGIRRSMLMVRESLRQFVREHISEPFWGIYNELVHNQPLTMTDAKALADSSHSLQRMLEAFIQDTKPELSQAEVASMAATGDMSVVSREYEKSIINAWKNFVAGDIVRMMLIQVQFIKRELLIATTAIGQLARENELNLRIMATVPAFLLAWGSYRAVRPLYYMLTSEKSRESTFASMRTIVLAMERLLNLRHREGTLLQLTADVDTEEDCKIRVGKGATERRASFIRPSGHSDNCTRQVIVPAGPGQGVVSVRVLDELDLGKLMMLIHEFRRLIRSGPRRFERRDLINCREDLVELVGERGLVSVGQQLAIVQRMQRSYKFLLPRR